MERIKINLPDTFRFSCRLHIRITDLNYGGHVGNDTFFSLLQEARQQFLNQFGYGELHVEDVGLIMSDAAIEFKSELNHGDEIEIFVAATGFTRLGFDLFYRVDLLKPTGNILAAKAKTGMLCYDYRLKKVVSIPINAAKKLEQNLI